MHNYGLGKLAQSGNTGFINTASGQVNSFGTAYQGGSAGGGSGGGASYSSPGGAAGNIADQTRRSMIGPAIEAPDAIVFRGWFNAIAVATAGLVQSGDTAWFPFLQFGVDARFGGSELLVVSAEIEQSPCDTTGVGGGAGGSAGAKAWGNIKGEKAALVIGRNLGLKPGVWNSRRAGVPGVDGGGFGQDEDAPIIAIGFPGGKYADDVPYTRIQPIAIPGSGYRLQRQDIFTTALVIDKTTYDAAVGGTIYGRSVVSVRAVRAE